ncbi:hypothetical protein MPTK1_2g10440 [Marchantia polymorpha subsp. ruderalis]|uniref:S-protein homolog n=1 Tax=Marchantia polymorpha TaxID=3197 RepID=A0A2R6XCD0_MARPO|nr:hypothetical protein MARPO_0023s0013 [Marchantia polymorpha]BBN01806.1 hypothetical protein Mp_2g10440 [Marchantia polymorpha subsp. ruderalis]|eukprot:PTQ43669.1 hypothetical protein MARPO_0023s0013 [Marchantia polymorpha]
MDPCSMVYSCEPARSMIIDIVISVSFQWFCTSLSIQLIISKNTTSICFRGMATNVTQSTLQLIFLNSCVALCITPTLTAGFGVQIQNEVSGPINLRCHDKTGAVKEKVLPEMKCETWEFTEPEIWTCDFLWRFSMRQLRQCFQVFKHDNFTPYLFCNMCIWRVRMQGFEIKLSDGTFLHVFDWQAVVDSRQL